MARNNTFVSSPAQAARPWYWHRVVPLLERRGHEVVAVDPAGSDDAAGLPEYAQAVVRGDRFARSGPGGRRRAVAGRLHTPRWSASRVPVALLVLVNAMIPAPGETPGAWWANTQQREARRLQNVRERPPGRCAVRPAGRLLPRRGRKR
jgi:hypothetical protein